MAGEQAASMEDDFAMRKLCFVLVVSAVVSLVGELRTAIAEAAESEPDFKLAYVLATASYCAYAVGELDDDHGRARAFECLRAAADKDPVHLSAGIPKRLMPAAIMLGASTFTMSALPGTPAIQNAIPMPFFGTTPFAAPGLELIASAIMLVFGLWWLSRAEARARSKGEGYGEDPALVEDTTPASHAAEDLIVRERATTASTFDPAEIAHSDQSAPGTAGRSRSLAADHRHRRQSCDVARPLAAPRRLLSR